MNRAGVLLDTGPLVALLHRSDAAHARAKALVARCQAPFRTCEAVLAEASYLLGRVDPRAQAAILALGRNGFLEIAVRIDEHWSAVERTLVKYKDVPAALADACLIRCAEIHREPRILTFDDDFRVYRWGGKNPFVLTL